MSVSRSSSVNAILLDVPADRYYADDFDGPPRLSQSVATALVERSPLHAWHSHPRLGGGGEPDTKATSNGSLLHHLLLGGGAEYALIEAPDYRKKATQELRDALIADGKVPVLTHVFEAAMEAAANIGERLFEALGFSPQIADREVTVLWEEDGVACKGRYDLWVPSHRRIVDLKFCKSANPRIFEAVAERFGYDIQCVAYLSAIGHVFPEMAGRVDFEFVRCEYEPPYAISVIPAGGSLKSLGELRWRRALARWRECLTSDRWPGYGRHVAEVRPYALERELSAAIEAAEPDWIKGEEE